MPLDCVKQCRAESMESSWPVGQHHSQSVSSKITILTEGSDTLDKKVMTDLSAEERGSVVEESSNRPVSLET